MKDKYNIANCECDDSTYFDIELTEEEANLLIKVFEENNKVANYCCRPRIYLYKEGINEALNRSYDELKESEENK